jgi:hypothetical protein
MSGRLLFLLLMLVLICSTVPAAALATAPATIIRQDVTGATVVCDGETLAVTSGTFQIDRRRERQRHGLRRPLHRNRKLDCASCWLGPMH